MFVGGTFFLNICIQSLNRYFLASYENHDGAIVRNVHITAFVANMGLSPQEGRGRLDRSCPLHRNATHLISEAFVV